MSDHTSFQHLIDLAEARQIKALSIRQPWAHRILHEGKDVENREWRTKFRGWVLIHAGLSTSDCETPADRALPRGAIVGAARIVDCVAYSDSPWFCGRWGFVLRDPVALPPIPCRGALGFFAPDAAATRATVTVLRDLTSAQTESEQ